MNRPLRRLVVVAALSAAVLVGGMPRRAAIEAASPPATADLNAVMTVALGVAVPTLDPGIPAGTPAATVRRHIYEGLVAMTEDGKIVGELARDWSVSPNGLVWTFHLQRGVQFHDGAPFDAAVLGVWTHGRAGDLAAERKGIIGLTAVDIIECLPAALQA